MTTQRWSALWLALLPVAVPARASEWLAFGKDTSGTATSYVDVESVRAAGELRVVAIKSVLAYRARHGVGSHAGAWVTSIIRTLEVNCEGNLLRERSQILSFEGGLSQRIEAPEFPTPWLPVSAGTLEGRVAAFVCGGQAP